MFNSGQDQAGGISFEACLFKHRVRRMKKLYWIPVLILFLTQGGVCQPVIGKKKFHLYMLAGQSNMAGRGKVEAGEQAPHPRVWMLTKDNKWLPATDPLHFDKPAVVGVGPGLAFARAMAEADTSVVIGLIPCAVGGSPIEAWEPGKYYEPTKSHPYDDAIRRTKEAMQKGSLHGILWHQGESDSDSTLAPVYPEKLKLLVARFRKDLNMPKLPFVAGTIAEFYTDKNPYAKRINEATAALPGQVKYTAFASASGLNENGDQTHFDTPSARELGRRYAAVFQRYFGKKRK